MKRGAVSKLPYYQPRDAFGLVEVVAPADRSGGAVNQSLLLNENAVRNMALDSAYREILQNQMDGMVEANDESFVNFHITKGVKRGSSTVTVFHTSTHILGEIVMDSDKISFVNMGPNIDTIGQVLHFGASQKHNVANQAGQHGEGLKRAALKFLNCGYRVDVYFAIELDQQTEFRHLIFKIKDKENCLAYSLSPINPSERVKGGKDFHRFEVIIRTGNKVPAFDIDRFMVKDPSLIRGAVNANDKGSLILDPRESGKIYVWHFFVFREAKVHFGYDFFLATISRDRDNVSNTTLCKSIATVWSQAIMQNAEMAKLFYTDFVMNAQVDNCMEVWALPYFPFAAVTRLFELYSAEHPGTRPISKNEESLIEPQFKRARFFTVPDHAAKFFNSVLPDLTPFLASVVNMFVKSTSVPLACPILMPALKKHFTSIRVILLDETWINTSMVHYAVLKDHLFISQHCINKDGTVSSFEGLCDLLFFCYKIFPPHFHGTQMMSEILDRKRAAEKPIIVTVDVDEEEGSAPLPLIPSKKRIREEEEEQQPPPGYEYYKGPPLLVKRH